jgi:hypothetical protein
VGLLYVFIPRQRSGQTGHALAARGKLTRAFAGRHGSARSAQLSEGSQPSKLRYGAAMPVCKGCGDEVDALVGVKVDGKLKKLCEDCADRANEQSEIAEQSEGAVQQMMGFKGRR